MWHATWAVILSIYIVGAIMFTSLLDAVERADDELFKRSRRCLSFHQMRSIASHPDTEAAFDEYALRFVAQECGVPPARITSLWQRHNFVP